MSVRGSYVRIDLGGVWIDRRCHEHVASLGDRLRFGSTRKQTVMADAMETLGQDMQQEATR